MINHRKLQYQLNKIHFKISRQQLIKIIFSEVHSFDQELYERVARQRLTQDENVQPNRHMNPFEYLKDQ